MNRVWAYIISKPLPEQQLQELTTSGNNFVAGWTAHENKLSAEIKILYNRIILINVHENVHNASGCSIDKLTRFIKDTEAKFNIELLNRFLVAYQVKDGVEIVHSSKIKDLLAQNIVTENTIVFNTAVANEAELQNWELKLKDTWLNKYLHKQDR